MAIPTAINTLTDSRLTRFVGIFAGPAGLCAALRRDADSSRVWAGWRIFDWGNG